MAMPGVVIFLEDYDLFGDSIESADFGEAVRALIQFARTGEEPDGLSPMATVCYRMLKCKVQKQEQKYQSRVTNGQRGGRPGKANETEQPSEETEPKANETEPKANETEAKANVTEQKANAPKPKTVNLKPENINNNPVLLASTGGAGGDAPDGAHTRTKAKRFVPPTRDEAEAYAREKGLKVDVDRFMDYYGSNGWKVGKNPMKDWRLAMNNWARNETAAPRAAPKPERKLSAYYDGQRTDDDWTGDQARKDYDDWILKEIMEQRGAAGEAVGVSSAG